MKKVTEVALERSKHGVFTGPEVNCWVGGSPGRQHSMLKRALAAGEVLRIHRGLYCLANRFLSNKPNPFVLAQRIYGPSYVSLESALSYHGWIPEATYAVTSTSFSRAREFDTPLGIFSFARVPQKTLFAGVTRVEAGESREAFFLASPAKALADYVYVHKCDWQSTRPLIESLRIEEESLASLDQESLVLLSANYSSKRVKRFLDGLCAELKL
ncbi:MAG: type IV toxin-antitoxin system AbiEi family antitoxin domain-containing protein [Planctomycetota bacterium]|nr:type IV toxin-antitoxin system AbiEi family antitoxin domain-containing protein [Planctomycetota bacterium]